MKKFGLLTFLVAFALLYSTTSNACFYINKDHCWTISDSYNDLQQGKDTQVKQVYTCPMHPDIIQDNPGKCPKCGMNLTQKEVKKDQFTCPMHPEVVQDKQGKCPKCGMNLVTKETVKEEYTCPMHSDVVRDKAGKCPKCGMNLVLKQPVIK